MSLPIFVLLPIIHCSENEKQALYLHNPLFAAAYFNTDEATRRAADARVLQSHQNYVQHLSMGQYLEPAMQPLYIVNFKCCRSDVFYIQEGTGLHVNVGDLVIVEADRGTDLGTVQHTKVSWEDARRYKEYYAEEHYKWLMMFSLQSRNGGPNVVNPNGIAGRPGSAVGGMGPQGHHGHDGSHQELKPKLIRRLAQNHEIQALKDKEGNEAKAKRVCQQKVIEHRLNMEILDAEFQMWVPRHLPPNKLLTLSLGIARSSPSTTLPTATSTSTTLSRTSSRFIKPEFGCLPSTLPRSRHQLLPSVSRLLIMLHPVMSATVGDSNRRQRMILVLNR